MTMDKIFLVLAAVVVIALVAGCNSFFNATEKGHMDHIRKIEQNQENKN